MSVKFLFFAQCSDWIGRKSFTLSIDRPAPVLSLLRGAPELAPILKKRRSLRVAVNREIRGFETEVRDGDEIAFLPPYSGG